METSLLLSNYYHTNTLTLLVFKSTSPACGHPFKRIGGTYIMLLLELSSNLAYELIAGLSFCFECP